MMDEDQQIKSLLTRVLEWGCVILFLLFYMMTVLYLYDDGIFLLYISRLRANAHSILKLVSLDVSNGLVSSCFTFY